MHKKGGLYKFLGSLLVIFFALVVNIISASDVKAEYGVGTGVNTSGGGCKVNSSGFVTNTNQWWDTCYGLAWHYYEWPTNSDGTPVNSDIEFHCTAATCGGSTAKNKVSKECGKPEYGGGFWYLGYEAYSPDSSLDGPNDAHNIGVPVGKPRVDFLPAWVSVPGVIKNTSVTAGLYPFGAKDNANNDVYNISTLKNKDYIDIDHTGIKKANGTAYVPGRCSNYSWIGNDKARCVRDFLFWPKILINGTYYAVESKYYGTTYEAWNAFQRIGDLVSGGGETTFGAVNWFCAGETGDLSGRSGVQVNSGGTEYTGWTNNSANNSTTKVTSSSSPVVVTGNVTVTFYHEVKGKGNTKASFQIDQAGLKSGQWVNENWNYSNSFDTAKSYSRQRVVSASEISSSGTTVCDTMTFEGNIQSTACVTLKAQVDIPKNNVNGKSTVSAGGSSAISEATNGGNGASKTIIVHVPVIKNSESINVAFTHGITATKSVSGVTQTANGVQYSVAQSTSGTAGGAGVSAYSLGTTSSNITVAAASPSSVLSVATPTVTVSGITASTDYTVCQTLSMTYGGGGARTTQVCARIIGHQISSKSTIKNTGSGATTNTSTDGGTASLTATDVVVQSGTKTITLNFAHELSMARHSGTSGAISANVSYEVTQTTSGKNATAATFNKATGTKTVTIANGANSGSVTASSGNITVSNIAANTDFTVCQTLKATYSSKTRTTAVCARIVGSSVSSYSSVKYGSNSAKSTSVNNATATETINITVANGGTTSVKVNFEHGISYSSAVSSDLSSTTSYTVTQKRDGGSATTVASGSKTLIMKPAAPAPSATVSSGEVTISNITNSTDTTVCQTLVAVRDGNTRTTTACARVVGNPVTGYSAASHTQAGSITSSTNSGTQTLGPVYVTVKPGASDGSAIVTFTHTAKITRTKNDSGTITTGNVPYTIEQTLDGLATGNVTAFSTVSSNVNLTLAASTPSATSQLKSTNITVSNITPSTDGKVCQKLTISNYVTTVCARIKGRNFVVRGQSQVGNSSTDIKKNTGWVSDATKVTADLGSIYAPYGGTSTKNVYFDHSLWAQLSGNTYANVGTGNITYTISRTPGGNVSANQTKSFTVSNDSATSASVWNGTLAASVGNGGNTICQKISFSYGTTSGGPEACATITGVPPSFTGKSTVTANGTSVETTTNNQTVNLPEIKLNVAYTKTVTQRITFGHNMTATSGRDDAKGKATGTMPYTISRDYGNNTTGNFSGTFPSNATTYTGAVGTSNDYVDVTVGPGESKTVCQTITFSGWSTKACAKVTGVLVLPDLSSQSSIMYETSSNTRTATTEWANKNSSTKSAEIGTKIYLPVREVEDANGGREMSLKFVHNLMAALVENMTWLNTGDVNYSIVTTHNGTTVDTLNNSFNHTVTSANVLSVKNISTNTHAFKVKINEEIRVCQAFTFSYKGANFSTTVCANVYGIPSDPGGRSTAKITGYGGVADTEWVNGRVSRVTLEVDKSTIKGSDVVFNHFVRIAGKRTLRVEGYTITNDYSSEYNTNFTGTLEIEGHSDNSYTIYSLYTNGRGKNITTADAQGMYDKGSACETLSFDFEGINYTSTSCIDFKKKPPIENEDDCPALTSYHALNGGETVSYSYVKSNVKSGDYQTLIYAKPTDVIKFTHCYYPGAQETRYTNADENPYKVSTNNGKTVIIPARNAYIESANDIEIKDKEGTDSFVGNRNDYNFNLYGQILSQNGRVFSGVVGNYNYTMFLSSETAVNSEAVGGVIEQSLWSYHGNNATLGHDRANCGSNCLVYYKNGDDNNWYNISAKNTTSERGKSSAAQVIVPYNYVTVGKINNSSDVVYPGESMSGGDVKIDVNKRYNSVVGEEYATKTAPSVIRLYTFYTENSGASEGADHQTAGSDVNACSYYNGLGFGNTCVKIGEVNDQVFNSQSKIQGEINEAVSGFEASYNVPDLPAGSKVCMGVSVYPAASTDTEPSNGNTFVSKAYCRTIAKKPSFQIWGGSLFAAGDVLGTVATKYTIKGVNDADYSPFKEQGKNSVNFGSWVEHAIMANGRINNVSSGAGTGYGQTGMVVDVAHPGGAVVSGSLTHTDFCNRSRLSFANTNCVSGYAGSFGAGGVTYTKTTLRQEFAEKAEAKEKAAGVSRKTSANWTVLDLSSPANYTQIDNVRYTFVEYGNVAITASAELEPGITHIVYAKENENDHVGGSIVIYGNGTGLGYGDGTYQTIGEIPQYVIIADKNLYIDRLVTRVDAILVAGGTINSCAKYVGDDVTAATKDAKNEIQDVYCNQQLRINGVVIADAMKLYRIYGASSGLDSITPAEVINYSPSVYMWGDDSASTGSPQVHTTYLRELAPRQ